MAKTILLADDSVTIQKVVELTFLGKDYQVVGVGDGTSALGRLPDVRPDLVIADVHMPGADGYEVCKQSKSTYPQIPVLLLVGTFEQFDEKKASASGADDHLKKPFDSMELLKKVETLIASVAGQSDPTLDTVQTGAVQGQVAEAAAIAEEPVAAAASGLVEPPSFEPMPSDELPIAPEPSLATIQAASMPGLTVPPVSPEAESEDAPIPLLMEESEAAPAEPEVSPVASVAPAAAEAPAAEAPAPTPTYPVFDGPIQPAAFSGPIQPAAMPGLVTEDSDPGSALTGDSEGDSTPDTVQMRWAPVRPEPAAAEPEPAAVVPEPVAVEPEPAAAEPEPAAVVPEPVAVEPEPVSVMPEPVAVVPEPIAVEPEAVVAEPEPAAVVPEPVAVEPEPAAVEPVAAVPEPIAVVDEVAAAPAAHANNGALSDKDVDRIARRVAELLSEQVLREVAWEVVPDLAEVVIKERIRELESEVES